MKHQRIAIIGGGIAGLYAAWRLIKADKSCRVHLFEASGVLGGRIKSVLLPGLCFKAELGAMRFRSNHLLLRALVDELRIPIRKFDVRPPRLRVRGRSLSMKELADGACSHCGAGSPYLLRPDERGKSPKDLVLDAIHKLLHDLSFPSLHQGDAQRAKQKILDGEFSPSVWAVIKRGYYDNTQLINIGFWNLLQHYLSNEAFQLVHDALSLESVLGNWSAAEAIPWFMADFASDDLYMFPDGMERVIGRVLESVGMPTEEPLDRELESSDQRLRISLGQQVTECRLSNGRWALHFDKPHGLAETPAEFDALVLALPKAALETLEIFATAQQRWKPDWLTKVQAHVLYKLFLLYEHPWWMGDDTPGYSVGRTYTDLPLRQVYYFTPDWMRACAKSAQTDKIKNNYDPEVAMDWSLVMASYSDEHYVNFWRTFAQTSDATPYYKAPSSMKPDRELRFRTELAAVDQRLRASRRIVSKVQQQLVEIHGHQIPEPIVGLYKDWGDLPFGGGWHTWNIGTSPWEHKPIGPGGIYMCGEACSEEQGWIEGALKTVERILLTMGVPPAEYCCGRPVPDLNTYVGHDPTNDML